MAVVLGVSGIHAQHRLYDLKIYVVLRPNGDAYIEEDRTMWLGDRGTEVYEKVNGLKDREMGIKDFGVRDSIYGEYERVSWQVDASRRWKAGRCGINHTEAGLELCWGFGEPGEHVFSTHYVLQNLIQSYTDYDGFNHCFYDAANPPAEKVSVYVWAADTTVFLSKENTGIWHFKYYGEAYFTKGGSALFESTEALNEGEKVVVMMQFKKGMFQPLVKHEETFAERVKERAFIDSDYPVDDPGDGGGAKSSFIGGDDTSKLENFIYMMIGVLVFIGLPLLAILRLIFKKPMERRRRRKLILKVLGNPDEIPYYRDVPLGGKLLRSQVLLRDVLGMLVDKPTFGVKQLTEALLLRLLYKGNIDIATEQDEKGNLRELFRIKPIEQSQGKQFYGEDEEMERGLQKLLYDAAGDDHMLQPKELRTYIKDETNALSFRSFAKKLTELTEVGRFSSPESRFKQVSASDAREVFGFWQYLNDFSLIGEREVVEVHLWKDYLVYGALFGIAKKVREGMMKICPDYTSLDTITQQFLRDNSEMYAYVSLLSVATYDTLLYSRNYETLAERRAREAREAARAAAQRRYSGGGGHSSFGGGGGFSGGGGSGVR